MSDWEYACRVAADGTSELLQSTPEFPARERNVCIAPAPEDDGSSPILLDAVPDGSGAIILVFNGNGVPSIAAIEEKMSGFDTWGVLTAERPLIEMTGPRAIPTFQYVTPGWEGTAELLGELATDGGGEWGGAGAGALINSGWPYFYRALATWEKPVADILAGAGIVPRPPTPPNVFTPAASQAEMTFRHLRAGGNAPKLGSDRISLGKDFKAIYEIAKGAPAGTRPVVRIDPGLAQAEGAQFLHPSELMQDLDVMERQFQKELADLQARGAGKGKIEQALKRLEAVAKARDYVGKYQEFHAVGGVPSKAVSVARGAWTEGAMRFGATHGLRVAGGALIVYGAYSSVQRVREAPKHEKDRVATQEVGGWVGGLIGAWSVGKVFAFGGAALGVEMGPGAIVTGLAGGLIGGVIGGIGGALGADWVYSMMEEDSAAECCGVAHGTKPEEIPVP